MPKDVLELRKRCFNLEQDVFFAQLSTETYRKEAIGPHKQREADVVEWLRGRGYIIHREPLY
jgi:hypothetical protein